MQKFRCKKSRWTKIFGGKNFGEVSTISVVNFGGFFISRGGKVNGVVDGPDYYVPPFPDRGLEILINAEFEIASDKSLL